MYFIGMKLSLKSPITLNLNQLEQKSAADLVVETDKASVYLIVSFESLTGSPRAHGN